MVVVARQVAALKYELHCVCIESLMEAVATLALTHYNLRAVRITGIPMKGTTRHIATMNTTASS